jgi:hypothetical protein
MEYSRVGQRVLFAVLFLILGALNTENALGSGGSSQIIRKYIEEDKYDREKNEKSFPGNKQLLEFVDNDILEYSFIHFAKLVTPEYFKEFLSNVADKVRKARAGNRVMIRLFKRTDETGFLVLSWYGPEGEEEAYFLSKMEHGEDEFAFTGSFNGPNSRRYCNGFAGYESQCFYGDATLSELEEFLPRYGIMRD